MGDGYALSVGEDTDNIFENDYCVFIGDISGQTIVKSISSEEYKEYFNILRTGSVIDVEINVFDYQELSENL